MATATAPAQTNRTQPMQQPADSAPRTFPEQPGGVRVEETVSILRPREELYTFWRNFENLPRFMRHLESVRNLDGNRSHWVARDPLCVRVEWDAEVTADRPNELIAWRSLPGSAVYTEGSVSFLPAPANRGAWVKLVMRYDPPGGKLGDLIARLFGQSAEQEAREDLRRFKRFMETGEIPTTKGQPSGRGRDPWEETGSMVVQDRVAVGLGWFSIGLGLAAILAPEAVARAAGVSDHRALVRLIGAREIATGLGIVNRRPRPVRWFWGRVVGDAMDLSLLFSALKSPRAKKDRTVAATAFILGVTAVDLLASLQDTYSPEAQRDGRPRDRARHDGPARTGDGAARR